MRRVFTFALSLLLLSLFSCAHKSSASKSETEQLNAFFARVFEENVARSPVSQTYLGRKTNYGKLDDATEEFAREQHKINKKNLKKLKEFDYEKLNRTAKLSYDIFKYKTQKKIESYKWRYHHYPLNQMFGFHSHIPSFLINMHRVSSKSDAMDYVSRLKEIERYFSEKQNFMEKQEKRGIVPPKFVFPKVIDDMKNIIRGQPFGNAKKDSPLFKDFKKKVSNLDISDEEKSALIFKGKEALLKYVRPAYLSLIGFTRGLQKRSKQSRGVWDLPNGQDFYEFRLERATTTNLTSNQIHNIGRREVKRIHGEIRDIMKEVDFKGDLQKFFSFMKSDRFTYPNTKAGREDYLAKAKEIIADMKKALPKIFHTLPEADLKVKPVEPYREKSAGIAFYNGPSLEGGRPGIYYVNLYKMEDNPKYKMEALAYHEAVPGHHMQIAIAKELKNLPKFRRTGGFTAYTEGWGLYAERIPKEIGFYKDPYSDFGRLAMELWRACRLVVDTGIHDKKWSREKAIRYLQANTPSADLEIEKAVERYFVMPGQATTYKIGMMKILQLRRKAKKKLGEKFDIRDFHDVVLQAGSLPLKLLERRVDRWISREGV